MKWQFIDTNTLLESESKLKILLVSGTWFHPVKLKTETPPGMPYAKQLQLVKSGLKHIRTIGQDKTTETRKAS